MNQFPSAAYDSWKGSPPADVPAEVRQRVLERIGDQLAIAQRACQYQAEPATCSARSTNLCQALDRIVNDASLLSQWEDGLDVDHEVFCRLARMLRASASDISLLWRSECEVMDKFLGLLEELYNDLA